MKSETILKIYRNQKESHCRGDWYQTLLEDFRFIEEEKCDERICKFSKNDYTIYIKDKVEKAAFKSYISKKEIHKKKLGDLKYERLKIQPYLNHKSFGKNEIQIICLLRSKSHPAQNSFRKMNKNNLNCSFKWNSNPYFWKMQANFKWVEDTKPHKAVKNIWNNRWLMWGHRHHNEYWINTKIHERKYLPGGSDARTCAVTAAVIMYLFISVKDVIKNTQKNTHIYLICRRIWRHSSQTPHFLTRRLDKHLERFQCIQNIGDLDFTSVLASF